METPPTPDERLIDGILRTRFGRENGPALENALLRITDAEIPSRRSPLPWLAAAAAIALAAGLWFAHQRRVHTGLTMGTGSDHGTILEKNTFQPAASGMPLLPGQIVRSGSPLALGYEGEKTTLELASGSELGIDSHQHAKNLRLIRGRLSASVAPQQNPMRIATPEGTAEVIGTRFSITAPPGATWLQVDNGTVKWRGTSATPVMVKGGHCIVETPGVPPGPYPLADGALPARLPFTWQWNAASTEGDGNWELSDGTLRQHKVAPNLTGSVPLSLPGQPLCPVSVYLADTDSAASFRMEATTSIDGLFTDLHPEQTLIGSVNLRLVFENQFLEFVFGRNPPESQDPAASYQALSLTRTDAALGYPSEILHGGLAPDFGRQSYRLIVQVERSLSGGAVVRGKIWQADASEPAYWSLQAWIPELGPLRQSGFATRHCVASFSHIHAYLIP